MLPPFDRRHGGSSTWLPEYLRRIVHYPQMDIEYTIWQMFYLCIAPSKVYRATSYHKQTKNQWARDDPAFTAILLYFMTLSSLSYGIAFHDTSLLKVLHIIFWTILVDFLFLGFVVATFGWFVANRFFRTELLPHAVEQRVEWAYAFDVHCNSFFPLFIVLYPVQYILLPLLLSRGFFACFVSNTLYAFAFAYYYRITFLGYSALPFLKNTVLFLYPIAAVVVLYCLSIVLNINLTVAVMNAYFLSSK